MAPGDKCPRGAVPKDNGVPKIWDMPSGEWRIRSEKEREEWQRIDVAKKIVQTSTPLLIQRENSTQPDTQDQESQVVLRDKDTTDDDDNENRDEDKKKKNEDDDDDDEDEEELDIEDEDQEKKVADETETTTNKLDETKKRNDKSDTDESDYGDSDIDEDDENEDDAQNYQLKYEKLKKKLALAQKVVVVEETPKVKLLRADADKQRRIEKEEARIADAHARQMVSFTLCCFCCLSPGHEKTPCQNPHFNCFLPHRSLRTVL